jgi:hypothetical protein
VSLRRLKYQLRCATAGHDTRPYLVGGTMVEHRCLRCGALVGGTMPAASTAQAPAAPPADADALAPRPSELPPAAPRAPENGAPPPADADGAAAEDPAEPEEDGDADALSALHALRELADLHAAGVLTNREFATKKAELLRRV